MYDTARRVALVKHRVRENTRRRQRREAISLSAFCLMLFTALAGAADALIVRGQTAAWGVFGAASAAWNTVRNTATNHQRCVKYHSKMQFWQRSTPQ